jgi:hypothetical protein
MDFMCSTCDFTYFLIPMCYVYNIDCWLHLSASAVPGALCVSRRCGYALHFAPELIFFNPVSYCSLAFYPFLYVVFVSAKGAFLSCLSMYVAWYVDRLSAMREKNMKLTDRRVRLTNEVLATPIILQCVLFLFYYIGTEYRYTQLSRC